MQTVQVTTFTRTLASPHTSCHQQGHASSRTLLQQNPPAINSGYLQTQVVLYNGRKTLIVVVVLYLLLLLNFFNLGLTYMFKYFLPAYLFTYLNHSHVFATFIYLQHAQLHKCAYFISFPFFFLSHRPHCTKCVFQTHLMETDLAEFWKALTTHIFIFIFYMRL